MAEHLIVVSHGMWGSPRDVAYLSKSLQKDVPDSIVLVSKVNTFLRTYHGLDVCGLRLTKEIKALLAEQEQTEGQQQRIKRISFVGYSAGGLIARYAIGLLFQEGFFEKVQPLAFITLATPHLGCRDLPETAAGRTRNGFMGAVSNFYSGRSGEQMMLVDGKHPLLLEMALPTSIFYQALARFQHIAFYANANRDNTVNYPTASCSKVNPYRGLAEPPIRPEGSKYRYVIKETLTNAEQRGAAAIEEVVVDDNPALPTTSHYDSHISPLVLPVLAPLLAVHAVVLMTPLRVISGYAGDHSQDYLWTGPSSSTIATTTAITTATTTSTSSDSKNTLIILPEATNVAKETVADIDSVVKGKKRSNKKGQEEQQQECRKMGGEAKGIIEKKHFYVDEVPELIRRHLITLPIRKVDVYIPGFHTHGSIIVRRAYDKIGEEVPRHVAEKLTLLLRGEDSNPLKGMKSSPVTPLKVEDGGGVEGKVTSDLSDVATAGGLLPAS